MKSIMFDVKGFWSTYVEIRAPDDTPDELMERAAGDDFEESFSLKDFMRGLDYEHEPSLLSELHGIVVIDHAGKVVDRFDTETEPTHRSIGP